MLNKAKGNMYDWITETWNPLGGVCPHACKYCYVRNFRFPSLKKKYSGPPRIYENEFKRNLGKDKFWFVGSCFDIFAESNPAYWIHSTFNHCRKYDNKYLFQSKNPGRIYDLRRYLPPTMVLGTTIETNRLYPEMGSAPTVDERAWAMFKLNSIGYKTMITIEPIIKFDLRKLVDFIDIAQPDWVNIGANTNKKVKLPEPPPEKVKGLIEALKGITEVKLKPNLKRLLS